MYKIRKILGNNLKRLRSKRNLTLEQLSEEIGISYQSISRVESGHQFPNIPNLELLCKYFDVQPAVLFSISELPYDIDDEQAFKLFIKLLKTIDRNKLGVLYKIVSLFIEETQK